MGLGKFFMGAALTAALAMGALPLGERLKTLTATPVGTAVNLGVLTADATYRNTLLREFNLITPENEMKMNRLLPSEGAYAWTSADQLVAFAKTNGLLVHGHTLVWYKSNPDWLTNKSPQQVTTVMSQYIASVCGHFAGKIKVWDVVNEAFNDDGTLRDSVWLRSTLGSNFIEKAFRTARAADTNAALIYMDYGTESINSKSTAILNFLTTLKNKGVPIHGVGFQCHLGSPALNYPSMVENLMRFAEAGFDVYIGEIDVSTQGQDSDDVFARQALVHDQVLNAARATGGRFKAFQSWGLSDRYSWLSTTNHPLMFDENYLAKPAYYALQDSLKGSGSFSGVYRIENAVSGKALNLKYGALTNNTRVEQFTYSGWSSQKWQLIYIDDGCYRLVNTASSKCLRVKNGSTALNEDLVQYDWNNLTSQTFRIVEVRPGFYKIVARHSSRVLRPLAGATYDAVGIVQDDWTGVDSELWVLTKIP